MEIAWDVTEEEAKEIDTLLANRKKQRELEQKTSVVVLSINDLRPCEADIISYGHPIHIPGNESHKYMILDKAKLIKMWTDKIEQLNQ